MRKTAVIVPAFALAAGAAGFFLRRSELSAVFDAATGLAERGAPQTLRLAILSAAIVLAAAVFAVCVCARRISPESLENAFAPANRAFAAVFIVLGAVWLAASVKYALNIRSAGALPVAELFFSLISALSAISVAAFAFCIYRRLSEGIILFFSVIPALFMCLWLVALYRRNASNPVLLSYCYQCLAIITSALSFYFTAGYAAHKPAPRRAVFSYLTAVFFCCTAIADGLPFELKTIYAVSAVTALVNSVLLIRNLSNLQECIDLIAD